MRRKKRRWETIVEDDPTAGLINLFDVWLVFAVALLLALVAHLGLPADLEAIERKGIKVPRYRITEQRAGGEGERLGMAYRLKSGEVVYVPLGGEAKR